MARSAAILALLVLTACASPAPLDVKVVCPPLRTWTAAEETALAAALAPIPEASPLWALEKDWQATRDAIRVCNTNPKP